MLLENGSVPTDRRVWQHSLALAESGARVFVVCAQYPTRNESSRETLEGVEIYRYDAPFSDGGISGYAREYGAALKAMRRVVREISSEHRIDVVHANNPPDILFLAARAARRRGAAFILDQHDLVPELTRSHFPGRKSLHWASLASERLAYLQADVVLVTTESYREIALQRSRKSADDIFLVRNAPNRSIFRPVEPDQSLKQGAEYLIGFAGIMGPQDGVDHTLRALAELKSRRADWRALIVGEGDVLDDMKALATSLGLDGLVEFTGWMSGDRLVTTLSSFDVCIAPNPSTPLNDISTMIKLLEYMAMGKPVVGYDLPESRRVAAGAAAYATANDPTSLAQTIAELLDDPARRREMGAIGQERIEGALSWDHARANLLAAYERAYAASDRRRGRP